MVLKRNLGSKCALFTIDRLLGLGQGVLLSFKEYMEAARKIRAVQFIFTSLPGELPGEGFTSYAFFSPLPSVTKESFKMCQLVHFTELLWTYSYFFFFFFVIVGQGPESLCDCSLMLI